MNIELLNLFYRKRKYLISTSIIGLIVSIIISLVITPKYKSSTVIYSSNLISNKGILFPNEILSDNEATNTEILMQFINSNEIKNLLLYKYELDKHYELDKNNPKFSSYYAYNFKENFKFSQTKYESILIEVYDKDPIMAKKLADGVVQILNQFIQENYNKLIKEKIEYLNTNLDIYTKKADSLKIIIKKLSNEFGLFDYYLQIEQLSKSFYKNLPQKSISEFNPEFKKISAKGSDFLQLTEEFKQIMLQSFEDKILISQEEAKLKSKINYIQQISKPEIPSEKYSPNKTLIVICLTLIFSFCSVLFLLLSYKFQKIKDAIIKE